MSFLGIVDRAVRDRQDHTKTGGAAMRLRTKAILFYLAATVIPLGFAAPLSIALPTSAKALAAIVGLGIAMFFLVWPSLFS